MYRLGLTQFCVVVVLLGMMLSGCEDNLMQRNQQTVGGKTIGGGHEGPGGLTENSNGRYPYPEIIEREYISRYDLFSETKCLAWRITWPTYDDDFDTEKIPTVLSVNNSALNSVYYLNNTSPGNTHKGTFSLYFNNKVESANTMWTELTYSFGADEMETVYFAESDQPLENIIDWVTKRPSLFKEHWPESSYNDMEYEEGDFIQFKLETAGLYGGIRIVSMTPRIIEVYLAVPNN